MDCSLHIFTIQAALSVAMVPLRDRAGETFVMVGTVKDMTLHPRQLTAAFIHVYQFVDGNTRLALIHKTQVEDVPKALAAFGGRLLAGIGNKLRLCKSSLPCAEPSERSPSQRTMMTAHCAHPLAVVTCS